MNAVIYCSNTGECAKIAKYLADKCGYIALDLCAVESFVFDTAVLVFPVHCQNIPSAVKDFLSKLQVKDLAVVAAYGKMSYGNVLYEVQKGYRHKIVAAAYVPTKHAYLAEEGFENFSKLDPIVEKLKTPAPVKIPKSRKNPFANFMPAARSRAGVKLYADGNCNNCGLCSGVCGRGAINCGKPNNKCIRCLKCVENCPRSALHFTLRAPMRAYLKNYEKNKLIIYI
ncbi:MAG: hypothetical protein K2H30_05850 [Clostridia bacterium]|nr:hypothetical protein [Clostridia bacterium]